MVQPERLPCAISYCTFPMPFASIVLGCPAADRPSAAVVLVGAADDHPSVCSSSYAAVQPVVPAQRSSLGPFPLSVTDSRFAIELSRFHFPNSFLPPATLDKGG